MCIETGLKSRFCHLRYEHSDQSRALTRNLRSQGSSFLFSCSLVLFTNKKYAPKKYLTFEVHIKDSRGYFDLLIFKSCLTNKRKNKQNQKVPFVIIIVFTVI